MEQARVGRPIDTRLVITEVMHYPTLRTVMAVEDVIRKSRDYMTKSEIMRRLGSKIMAQTLNTILAYLEDSGKILIAEKGVLWTRNESPRFRRLLRGDRGIRI